MSGRDSQENNVCFRCRVGLVMPSNMHMHGIEYLPQSSEIDRVGAIFDLCEEVWRIDLTVSLIDVLVGKK